MEAEQVQKQREQIFTDGQIGNFTKFFDTLKRIHTRLAIEGYEITRETIKAPTTRPADTASKDATVSIN